MRRTISLLAASLSLFLAPTQCIFAESVHSYFDWLSARPETIASRGYRSQAEIDADTHRRTPPSNTTITYDADMDAARVRVGAPNSIGNSALHPSYSPTSTGALLYTWDVRWDTSANNVNSPQKTFQIAGETSGTNDNRRIEVRTRFDQGNVGYIDVRRYIWGGSGDNQPMGHGGCEGQCQINKFLIAANTWTRYWCEVNFERSYFSMWVADETRAPVKLFDKYPLTDMSGKLNKFWFEYNASREGGAAYSSWFRNFIVLKNVSDPSNIVNKGATVGSGAPLNRPNTPTHLRVD